MLVDASALVAMMTDEGDARALAGRLMLGASQPRFATPIAVFETERFLDIMDIEVVSLPAEAGAMAVKAFARFGKGQGHPAQLNMGDCLTYAAACCLALPLLFKGGDFAQTDIMPA